MVYIGALIGETASGVVLGVIGAPWVVVSLRHCITHFVSKSYGAFKQDLRPTKLVPFFASLDGRARRV